MIFTCLTLIPKGEHLKIIELESPPSGEIGGQLLFGADSNFEIQKLFFKQVVLAKPFSD